MDENRKRRFKVADEEKEVSGTTFQKRLKNQYAVFILFCSRKRF